MKTVRLGDICDIVSGGTPSRAKPEFWQGGTIPWIKIGNIKGKHVSEADEYITKAGLDGSSAKMLPRGTILYTIFATLGEVGILDIEACTNQAIAGISVREASRVQLDYLYYYLKSKKSYVDGIGRGVAQNNINMSMLRDFSVPLPTIAQQDSIVAILDRVSSVIGLRQQQLSALDDLIKARFVEMFGDPISNNLNWEKRRFDSLCENLDGKRKPITSTDRVAGPYPYYGASGIVDHVADYIFDEDILLISEDGANLLARSTPIAFSVKGKVWVNNHAHVLRFRNYALQKYIERFFEMISIEDYITGSTQPKLNQAKLNSMMIPIPKEALMVSFLDMIEQVDKSKSAVQKALEQAQLLFDSLMQQYFS